MENHTAVNVFSALLCPWWTKQEAHLNQNYIYFDYILICTVPDLISITSIAHPTLNTLVVLHTGMIFNLLPDKILLLYLQRLWKNEKSLFVFVLEFLQHAPTLKLNKFYVMEAPPDKQKMSL